MTTMDQGPTVRPNLVERASNIILKPKLEWDRIDPEPATVQGLYASYICILAAIGPVCGAVGALVFGYHVLGYAWRPPVVTAISSAIVSYVLALVSVGILALIIDALAPTFGGQKNRIQAFKVAAYASTASWVSEVFRIVPPLSVLAILGLYSLYLLYLGLPKLMRTSQDKALPYVGLIVLVAIVIAVVIGMIAAPFETMGYRHVPLGGSPTGF